MTIDVPAPRRGDLCTLSRRGALAGLGLLTTLPAAWPALAAAPRRDAGANPVRLPPLGALQRTLANGLLTIAIPDRHTASVSVQVWYRVGGKDDPPGRSGFAHLFEHMMFKSTRHMAGETFDRLTEDVGGQNNAFTAEDMTAYQSEVPSNHLETPAVGRGRAHVEPHRRPGQLRQPNARWCRKSCASACWRARTAG